MPFEVGNTVSNVNDTRTPPKVMKVTKIITEPVYAVQGPNDEKPIFLPESSLKTAEPR